MLGRISRLKTHYVQEKKIVSSNVLGLNWISFIKAMMGVTKGIIYVDCVK